MFPPTVISWYFSPRQGIDCSRLRSVSGSWLVDDHFGQGVLAGGEGDHMAAFDEPDVRFVGAAADLLGGEDLEQLRMERALVTEGGLALRNDVVWFDCGIASVLFLEEAHRLFVKVTRAIALGYTPRQAI